MAGDVLVFADAVYPCHCGFLTVKHGVPHLLHAHALRRKVIEEPYTGEWPAKVKFASASVPDHQLLRSCHGDTGCCRWCRAGYGDRRGPRRGLAGSALGNVLFPSQRPASRVEGLRLGDLTVTSSAYGAPIAIAYGTLRLAGNMIWSSAITEQRNVARSQGGGGASQTAVSYAYTASFAIGLAEGPAEAVLRLWADGKLIYDRTGASRTVAKRGLRFRLHLGDETQLPDPLIEAQVGEGRAPAHRGLAYIVVEDLPLADFGNRIPNITAEVVAAGSTVHPAQHIDLPAQGVSNWGKAEWRLDPERPFIYNVWSSWLLKINAVSGEVVYRVRLSEDPAVLAWWQEQGWSGDPDLYAYTADPTSGDRCIALNGARSPITGWPTRRT